MNMAKNRPQGLENFEAVWKRVQNGKPAAEAQPQPQPGNAVIMPRRKGGCRGKTNPPR